MVRPMIRSIAFSSLMLALALVPAAAEPVSAWVDDASSKIRLIDAGAGPAVTERLAGIEIALGDGWKTYWRQPGATGVPPSFDFSASENLSVAEVAFPPPERQADEEGVTNVYHHGVVLPVIVRAKDPAAPVILRLVADYGACEKICVPVRAETMLTLKPGGSANGPAADATRAALALAPKPASLGASGPLAIRSVAKAGADALEIVATAPAGGKAVLFAEAGDGSYVPSPDLPRRRDDGALVFRIALDEPTPPASGLRLTLATGANAIETVVSLDEIASRP
jgi:DsbC/DsbD-like thiol-disulfide interchange protein